MSYKRVPDETFIGQKFSRWNVVGVGGSGKEGFPKLICRCDCGATKEVYRHSLVAGRSKSCGCLQKDVARNMKTTHGAWTSGLYFVWKDMHRRCYDQKHKSYARYGGRGIAVCERWHVVENFISDMGQRPAGTSLDRIDNDKGYSPDNCKWSTNKEQQLNKSCVTKLVFEGVEYSVTGLSRIAAVSWVTFKKRLADGWPIDAAVRLPGTVKKPPEMTPRA